MNQPFHWLILQRRLRVRGRVQIPEANTVTAADTATDSSAFTATATTSRASMQATQCGRRRLIISSRPQLSKLQPIPCLLNGDDFAVISKNSESHIDCCLDEAKLDFLIFVVVFR